ncbi:MAG TPA: hypothetical protein VEK76_07375 [Candidatus Binatia bacterium]|nr:hypothetical protein [Candidatus Binatia bacterium]
MTRSALAGSADGTEPPPVEDPPALPGRLAWLTPKRLAFFVIAWMIAFSLGSILISNPFESEPSASATPDFWHVMYLHGLLIAMVGLLGLMACQVLSLRSAHVRLWITIGVVVATLADGIGGIFDTRIPGAEAAMWTQIVGFFALDEILLMLIAGMVIEAIRKAPAARSLAFWVALAASASMLAAALMGHLAGWLLEFGAWPAPLAAYLKFQGLDLGTFTANLVGSHSHDMVVAVMALLVAVAARQFGMVGFGRAARTASRVGLTMVGAGIAGTTVMYLAMGFTTWGPPTLFQSGANNGIAGDDIVTGMTVMLGGLVTLVSLAAGRGLFRPLRVAAATAWMASFATVVVGGYLIELHESFFGQGDPKAAGAANDAVFTWLHQDVGFFLLPTVVLIMLVVQRYIEPRLRARLAATTAAGITVTFIGAMLWVFSDPSLHGPGYVVTLAGLCVLGAALVASAWFGLLERRALRLVLVLPAWWALPRLRLSLVPIEVYGEGPGASPAATWSVPSSEEESS